MSTLNVFAQINGVWILMGEDQSPANADATAQKWERQGARTRITNSGGFIFYETRR
jgi:hypothetical protein